MLELLQKKLKIPQISFMVIADIGNTRFSNNTIALKRAEDEGNYIKEIKVFTMGFGVELSWGSTIITY